MDYIRFAISNPVKVSVGVLLLILFGLLAVFTIPIQLIPNVDKPVVMVQTNWTGRSPQEIEREIVEEQEDKLKRTSGLKKMTAEVRPGAGDITLEFNIGTDIDRARLEVSDKLREVPDYPDDVDEPVVSAADSASDRAIAWMVLTADDPKFDIESLRDVCEEKVKPFLERVDGLAVINVFGGRDREVQIRVDPRKLAQRGITLGQLRDALRNENVNISAGDLPAGRLDVRVRTLGQYENLDDIRRTIVTYQAGGPVRVEDLGEVELALAKPTRYVRSRGQTAIAFNAVRETGSNVIEVMQGLQKRIDMLNEPGGLLDQIAPGQKLHLKQVYDETNYIYDALDLVVNNLWIGGGLAGLILLLFLRKIRPTMVISLAIPVSVIGTFVVLTAFGRDLNVISLAGLAFAVGMVVDNAIVVLENIDRHLDMGKPPRKAAYDATKEVWGAIVASTLTTLAVFIPVIFIEEEAGQLFRDIALAICAAVTLSLIVSVTVIPTASARFLRHRKPSKNRVGTVFTSLFGVAWLLSKVTGAFAWTIHKLTGRNAPAVLVRLIVVAAFTVVSLLGAWLLKPPANYLPAGNRNLVIGLMFTPPSYSIEQNRLLGERIEEVVKPYWWFNQEGDPRTVKTPPFTDPRTGQVYTDIPPIENFFFVVREGTVFIGAASADKDNVKPLETLLNGAMATAPGCFGFAAQGSIFGRGLGGTNAIDVELSGTNLNDLRLAAREMNTELNKRYGFLAGGSVRPQPLNFDLPGPEMQWRIDRVRAGDLKVSTNDLGLAMRAMVDGAKVGDYYINGEQIDLIVVRDRSVPLSPEQLGMIPVAVNVGNNQQSVVPLSAVAHEEWADAPQQINRIEEERSVTLTVVPPAQVAMEDAINNIEAIRDDLRAKGKIPVGIEMATAGTADQLTKVREAMLGSWHGWTWQSLFSLIGSRLFLALLITYLLMAALFESWIYPLVIMFSVPLAAVGGFMGLAIVHYVEPTQQLDTLTMLGFVILIGIVVNNAILIVHQALNFMRGEGDTADTLGVKMNHRDAIRESVRSRIRPIFMTTLTSVFGMTPLVLSRYLTQFGISASGSELYVGLGSVVIGGLVVSTVFTLVVVPLVFSLFLDLRDGTRKLFGIKDEDAEEAATPAPQQIKPATA